MKRTLSIAAAATFAMALPAFAAVITVDAGAPAVPAAAAAGAAAGAGQAGANPAAPAAVGGLAAFFNLRPADSMAATVRTTDAEVAAIAGVKDVTKVTVRQIRLGTAPDAAAVNKVKTDNAAETARLQAALNANAAFKAELSAKMVDPATIVAMEVAADGTITLYSLS
jgi:hypothetical protein